MTAWLNPLDLGIVANYAAYLALAEACRVRQSRHSYQKIHERLA
jgi:hypothetical protein